MTQDARSLIDAAVRATGAQTRYRLAKRLDIEPRYVRRWYAANRLPRVSRSFLAFVVSSADVTAGMLP